MKSGETELRSPSAPIADKYCVADVIWEAWRRARLAEARLPEMQEHDAVSVRRLEIHRAKWLWKDNDDNNDNDNNNNNIIKWQQRN